MLYRNRDKIEVELRHWGIAPPRFDWFMVFKALFSK